MKTKTAPNQPIAAARRAKASLVLALIVLAVGAACIMAGQSPPGLILVFAAVAGVMTSWQLRKSISEAPPDDHAA